MCSLASWVGLEPTQQSQDKDYDEDEADNSRRPIPPTSTMTPPRNDAEQGKNEDDDKDCA